MKPSDLADVGGHAYTYLVNGKPPAANWTGRFTPGERVRLRFINGSAMTTFDIRIPGLAMTVVAADGQYVLPVEVDELRMAAAETFDIIVAPSGVEAFTIFAQSADRAGFARATLAAREGAVAAVPELDAIQYLTMADMGHAHGASHPAGATAAGDQHGDHATASPTSTKAEHAGHPAAPDAPAHDHGSHGADGGADVPTGPEPSDVAAHAGHASGTENAGAASPHEHSGHEAGPQTHPESEANNPAVDMQAAAPSPRLDDPGVGLRDNGRRVLTYGALRSAFAEPDEREPERTIELHLTGNMDRFMWSFDGIPFSQAQPIELRFGERVRFVLVNDTMMEHPIHLHGLWSDLEDENGRFLVRKHTINFAPGTKRAFRVTADAPGPWAFHCHLLFHMEAGMFRVVRIGQPEDGAHDHSAHHHG
jgi:CopA family copper-resistance protein